MYSFGEEEINAFKRVVDSKKFFRYQGPNIETECFSFEKEFAQFHGVSNSVVVTSGTNALVASMIAAGIGPSDEVLVPAYTFFATVAAVVQVGATPILVNVDEKLSISVSEAKKKINSKTKAIIAVHMDGLNCQLDELVKLCLEKNILLIEDVAQAIGGEYQSKKLGSYGEYGCYSFNQDKIITAGEGGAVTIKNSSNYHKVLNAHDTCNQFGLTLKNFYNIETFIGNSMRVSEFTGAILREQLKKLPNIILSLRKNKNYLLNGIIKNKNSLVTAHDPKGDCGSSLHILCNDPLDALSVSKKLIKIGLRAAPISARPAHAVWQWIHLLREARYAHPIFNPKTFQKDPVQYELSEFAPSVDLISRLVKIEMQLDWDNSKLDGIIKAIDS